MKLLDKIKFKIKMQKCKDNGRLSIPFLFLRVFKKYPDLYAFELNQKDKINVSGISDELLKEMFPDCRFTWKSSSASAVSTSAVDDFEEEEFDDSFVFTQNSYTESSLNIITKKFICCIYQSQVALYYKDYTLDEVQDIVNKILEKAPRKEEVAKNAKISLVCSDGRDYYTTESAITKTTVDIETNYNDDFKEEYDKILEFLSSKESGLVLLHGPAGTGKTTLIRHLITNCPKEYILIPPGMMQYISSPEFISFIMSHRNSVFILEDCEQVLVDRRFNNFNNGISTILNMSDGLLSDVFNLKFICTFNADITAIDEALTRPGRCYSNYEFGPLSEDKIKKLAEINKIEMTSAREMSLADLFNKKFDLDTSKKEQEKKKIGF